MTSKPTTPRDSYWRDRDCLPNDLLQTDETLHHDRSRLYLGEQAHLLGEVRRDLLNFGRGQWTWVLLLRFFNLALCRLFTIEGVVVV